MPEKNDVLALFQKIYPAVSDGRLEIVGERVENGAAIWDLKHIPDDSNPLMDKIMKTVRSGTIRVQQVDQANFYEMDMYGGSSAVAEIDGQWHQIQRQPRAHGIHAAGMMNKVVSAMRAAHDNILILDVAEGFSERSVIVTGVETTSRKEQEFIVSFTADGSAVEEVRKLKDDSTLGLNG